jgi:membrane fusion protein (multidrug efflux system)
MIKTTSIGTLCLLLFACGGKEEQKGLGPANMKPDAVEVFIVESVDVPRLVEVPGTVIPSEEVQLFSEISGRVQKINFKEGQRVQKGALLLQVDTDVLRAQKQQLIVELDLARKDEARKKNLLNAKGLSLEEYEKSASQLASVQAQIDLLNVQVSKGAIRAPFSGRIGLRRISEGAYISPATQITTLVQDNPIKIEFSVSERYASAVKAGQTVKFKLEKGNKEYTGKVYAFEPFINSGTRMLTIRAELRNDGQLMPGAFVAVEYDLGFEKGAVMVPAGAIIPVLKGQKVWVVRDGKVAEVPVEVGIRTSDKVQVMGDLKTGDQVLVSGLLAVRPGMPVTIKKSNK